MKSDPRIDAYIDRQAEFAKPILRHLRETVHAACPDCEETLKWSSPTFMYRGQMLAGMAAFKQHATFGFWRGSLVVGDSDEQMSAMGQFGRLTSLDDLPPKATLVDLTRKSMKLIEEGAKPGASRAESAELREARKRIKLLEQENEVLRRATAYLSQANLPGKGSTRS